MRLDILELAEQKERSRSVFSLLVDLGGVANIATGVLMQSNR